MRLYALGTRKHRVGEEAKYEVSTKKKKGNLVVRKVL